MNDSHSSPERRSCRNHHSHSSGMESQERRCPIFSLICRRSLDTINRLNREHLEDVQDPEIFTQNAAYEMAYKMQTSVPSLMDIAGEPASIHEMYGTTPGEPSYANNCLLARRLVERGVRFVQLCHRAWDMHGVAYNNDVITMCPRACRET